MFKVRMIVDLVEGKDFDVVYDEKSGAGTVDLKRRVLADKKKQFKLEITREGEGYKSFAESDLVVFA